MTRKKPARKRPRSAVAKDLYTPKYRPRVVELKTRYRRRKKKEKQDEDE